MAEDAKGKAEHLGGRIQEKAGELVGDREMEREGRLNQQKGRAEQDESRAEEQVDRARREKLDAEARKERADRAGG